MHSCMYTLGLCVQSHRDAHHKQTFASRSFQENKGFFHPLMGKHCTRSEEEPQPRRSHPPPHPSSVSGSQLLCISLPKGPCLAQPCRPPLSWGRWRSKRGSCPTGSLSLQGNWLATQHFPTEGPPNAQIISLFSLPASEASLLLAVEKPGFLESSRFLLKIGIPVKEADASQALPFCPDLHPSLGNSPSWKCFGYKYSPKNSL